MRFAPTKSRTVRLLAVAAVLTLGLAGCQAGPEEEADDGAIRIGTTEAVAALDPACSYGNGSTLVMNQVYPFLLNTAAGSPDVQLDIAASASFTSNTEYTVTLKPDLTFANGNDLTSSDVVFTFQRQLAIADPSGPSGLLYNLASVTATDDVTVVFKLKTSKDQIFPKILASLAGPIVDEQTMSPDACTSDADVVAGGGFAGQYSITGFEANMSIEFTANPDYEGVLGEAENELVRLKFYPASENLSIAVQDGSVDVAYRALAPSDVEELRGVEGLTVVDGPGGDIQYIVFNFNTQPFGATTEAPDPAKALAVRQAVADLVDRSAIASEVFSDTAAPLYSFVPEGLTGAIQPLLEFYGDGSGAPAPDRAAERLAAAGITEPVELELHYVTDRYGPSWADAYELIKEQLESSGLFTVTLEPGEWTQYREDRVADLYPAYQLGWSPDYSDADSYLTPFFLTAGNFPANHYGNQEVNQLVLDQSVSEDPAARQATIETIQSKVAAELPTLPLLQMRQVAVVSESVDGVTLDASFKFRFGSLVKD